MKNELQGSKEVSEAEMHLDSWKITLKKVENWIAPGHDEI